MLEDVTEIYGKTYSSWTYNVSYIPLDAILELNDDINNPFKIKPLIEEINSFYPPDIVKYYSPDYAAELLGKISGGDKNKPADDEV